MATYDTMGNYTGYDVADPYEEERKRKLAEEEKQRQEELANQAVQTHKTTTYGDGSRTHTVTSEIPAPGPVMPQQAPAPQARAMPIPSNVQPVTPDSFQKIRQMESGNRDFTPQGTPVTSPAGAMFASQVMPSTAQQPGFGIQPAQNQTSNFQVPVSNKKSIISTDRTCTICKYSNGDTDLISAFSDVLKLPTQLTPTTPFWLRYKGDPQNCFLTAELNQLTQGF